MTEPQLDDTGDTLFAGQPVRVVERDGVRYTLLGTAHVSQASVEAVERAIGSGRFGVPMDLIELERGMLMTMPGGWKMGQLEATQPTTTYGEFKREILNEIARCLNMPFAI